MDRLAYGKQIEERACEWLLRQYPALRLLERNYRWRGGEIDLIFEEGNELVFVEVRARRPGSWVGGIESVTFPKQLRLSRTVRRYLARYRGDCRSARLDIVGWDGSAWRVLRDCRLFLPVAQ